MHILLRLMSPLLRYHRRRRPKMPLLRPLLCPLLRPLAAMTWGGESANPSRTFKGPKTVTAMHSGLKLYAGDAFISYKKLLSNERCERTSERTNEWPRAQ